jgi:shikimate kinase
MKVFSLEATDMGKDQQEIADKCEEYVSDIDFENEEAFYAIESKLIKRACAELGWHSVPSTGGLVVNWE